MGKIYKIEDDINHKVYIGQTAGSIQQRYEQHLNERFKNPNRRLYKAMNQLGIEHFSVIEIEDCVESCLDDREQYWIKYYDSYNNGYNMTIGGNGGSIYDIDIKRVYQCWDNGWTLSQIADEQHCSVKAISIRLQDYPTYSSLEAQRRARCLPVYGYDYNGMPCLMYDSAASAEKALTGANHDNINANCRGEIESAYGYRWTHKYVKSMPSIDLARKIIVPVLQYSKNNEYVATYPHIKAAQQAMREQGYSHAHIGEVCARKPRYNTAAGYKWRYICNTELEPLPTVEMQNLANLLDD